MLKTIYQLKFITSLAFILLFLNINAQVIDGIAAVVEDEIVLFSDIEVQYQQMVANGVVEDDMRCVILDQLLLDKLFVVQAQRDSIVITNDEVSNELERRIQYFVSIFGSEEALEEYYGKTLFDLKEEFRDDIYQQLLSDRMQSSIFADIYVAPEEVKTFFDEIPADSLPFFNAEVEVGQIVILAEPNILQKEAAKQKALEIRKDILEGGDFEFQALLYSDDPGSATEGGSLGFVKRGDLVTPFEAAAFRLKKGEISDVVESQFGFHIIQLIERQGERINVRHILITPDIDNSNVIDAEDEMKKVLKEIKSGKIAFQKGVALYSNDETSKNNGGMLTNPETGNTFFEMSALPGDIALALENVEVGGITEILPFSSPDGKYGFKLILLKSESEAHKASLETDYTKIKGVAKQAKQAKELEKWVAQKSKTVFIKISDQYSDCEGIEKWMK